jgi:RNA polymerase sigma-70 factor, ECF subfamily
VTIALPASFFTQLLTGLLSWRSDFAQPAEESSGETDCMRRVAAGDDTALQQLFDRWKLPLLSFFYRALGSHADAEDLTLEVFVRLHRSAVDYRPTARFSTYLFHIAHNLLRNEYRRRQRKPAQPVAPESFDYVPAESDGAAPLAELEEVFQRALLRLPEKYRTPLLLLQQQQLDYPEAAAVLRISENSLRVLVHRGRRLLKTEMETIT